MESGAAIRLLISDVDGTLLDSKKRLLPSTIAAVQRLQAAGIEFCLTSSRPPRGMQMLVEPLGIKYPLGGFNGGLMASPDASLKVLDSLTIPDAVVPVIIAALNERGLDVWVYRGNDWYVLNEHGPHVDHDAGTVGFRPEQVSSFDGLLTGVHKIVGVSDDLPKVAQAEKDAPSLFGPMVSATRSHPYYLDITHRDANKGTAVHRFSTLLNIPIANIACIGDGSNDMLMFKEVPFSIAMGNGEECVRAAANHVTGTNDADGYAAAIDKLVIPAALRV